MSRSERNVGQEIRAANVLANPGTDEIQKHAVAAPEVGHDVAVRETDVREQAPHPLDRVRTVRALGA
jgi:hypothetical protein